MRGIYALLIEVPNNIKIAVGKLGRMSFKPAPYVYIGSSLKSLEGRIRRHLSDEKRKHWHIDYLLAEARITDVIFGESDEKKECEIAENLSKDLPVVKNFGSSDCSCKGHLFYGEDPARLEDKVEDSFRMAGLNPEHISGL